LSVKFPHVHAVNANLSVSSARKESNNRQGALSMAKKKKGAIAKMVEKVETMIGMKPKAKPAKKKTAKKKAAKKAGAKKKKAGKK